MLIKAVSCLQLRRKVLIRNLRRLAAQRLYERSILPVQLG
jgi:hypothetical protein